MRGIHSGTTVVDGYFRGMANGTVVVPSGSRVEIAGMVNGTLIAGEGSHVRISGMVNGSVVDRGATIEVTGMVNP